MSVSVGRGLVNRKTNPKIRKSSYSSKATFLRLPGCFQLFAHAHKSNRGTAARPAPPVEEEIQFDETGRDRIWAVSAGILTVRCWATAVLAVVVWRGSISFPGRTASGFATFMPNSYQALRFSLNCWTTQYSTEAEVISALVRGKSK